ncbi:methyltransferase domain-containing protein [Pseudooceanicola sp. MF1-13]|uniref:methyltransferase domain-containing protein n=1 Tax=Pseudooceanicola sp. MF1-13 TaxID=3379095 RepID=UPI00389219FC
MSDWNPETYSKFATVRLRPAVDLAMRLAPRDGIKIVDLGCGTGSVAAVLRARFADSHLTGVDTSPAMLQEAWNTGHYDALEERDIAQWKTKAAPDLIFSNAALHWVPDHDTLLPRLVDMLAPGGTLAVQVPHQNNAPSHRLWYDLAEQHFPGKVDPDKSPGIPDAPATWDILEPLGALAVWQTEYFQHLGAGDDTHPVRQFTSATYARPVLDALSVDEQKTLCAAYDEAMEAVYPRRDDGSVLFPFRRLFYTLTRS